MATADLVIRLITDTSRMKGLDEASGKFGRVGAGLRKAAVPAGIALGAIVAFGAGAVKAASDTQQAMGGVDAVFGTSSSKVKQWAADAADSVGLAESEYASLATTIGGQLKAAGVPMDQVAGKTRGLIKTAADLAATYGGTTQQAVEALGSAMRGEADPAEAFNLQLKQSKVAAQMAADGTDKLTGKQADQARMAAILALVHKQSADATGQFAEESDTAAGQAQRMTANYANLQSELGTALLPILSTLVGKFSELAKFMAKHKTITLIVVGAVAALAAGILVLNAAMTVYSVVTAIAASETALMWLAAIWPIALVVVAVLAVVAVIVILWKKCEWFRNAVKAVWNVIRTTAVAAWNAIKKGALAAWGGIKAAASAMGNAVKSVWNSLKSAIRSVIDWVKSAWRAAMGLIKSVASTYINGAKAIFNGIKTVVGFVVSKVKDLVGAIRNIQVPGAIKSAFESVKSIIDNVIDAVQRLIGFLRDIPTPHIDWPSPPSWFNKVMPGMAPAPPVPAGVGAFAAPGVPMQGATARAGGAPVQIVIQGALDPDAVARQIGRLLSGHDRRTGSSGLRRASVVVR